MKGKESHSLCFNRVLLSIAAAFIFLLTYQPSTANSAPNRVLFINSYHKGYEWSDKLVNVISKHLEKEVPGVELFVEYMDTKRFKLEEHHRAFLEFLSVKYAERSPHLVIASDDNAFQFCLRNLETLFGEVPLVFLGVNNFSLDMIKGKEDHITGIVQHADVAETIELALGLHPHVKKVAVLTDATPTGEGYLKQVQETERHFPHIEFSYLSGRKLTTEEMLKRLDGLSQNTIVLLCIWVKDKVGKYTPCKEIYPEITRRSPVPVYGVIDSMLQYGVVGGKVQSPVYHGLEAARIAVRVLNGEKVSSIPVMESSPNVFMFDWKALKSWGIPEESLPQGSVITNKVVCPYERIKPWLVIGIIAILVLSGIILALWGNILARKRAERRYRTLFENSRDAISLITAEGEILDVNDSWCRLFGYKREELPGLRAVSLWANSEKRREWQKELEVKGSLKDYPFIARTKEGKERNCLITTTVSTLEGRKVYQSIVRDVTKHIQMEQALRESEEKFSKAFSSSPHPMCISTLEEGRYIEVNEACCRMFSMSKDEFIGRTSLELALFSDPKQREKGKSLLEKYGRIRDYEVTLLSKDGERRHVLWSAELIQLGGKTHILSVLKDITERKLAEEELRRERERFSSLVEHAPFGVALVGKDATYQYVNPAFTEIFGFTLDEIPDGRSFLKKAFPDQDEYQRVVEEWKKALLELRRHRVWPRTFTVSTKDGTKKIVKFRVVQLHTGDFLVTYEDVTDLEMLQRQILHAQKMESVGTLAGGVAHDFNNSLQAILGFTQLLLMESQPGDPHFDKLKKIEEISLKSRDLVRQLLTFSRKVESKRQPLDLNREIREMEKLLKRTIPKMIQIELHLAEEISPIEADPIQVEQVIMNIAVNARDAMPGGGRLTIETADVTLTEEYAKTHLGAVAGDYVMLSISDTGEGMDKETLNRIYEPFFTTKEVGKGTGLGLAMVYGIVKEHNGYITCYSEKGKGTTFKIYFPALSGQKAAQGQFPEQEQSPEQKEGQEVRLPLNAQKSHLIMVVDDEESLVQTASEMLRSAGYDTISATSGAEAIRIYKERMKEISLVILDYAMPSMDGGKCLEDILGINPEAKVLIASGFGDRDLSNRLKEKGAEGFIPKPFEINELLRIVGKVLNSKGGG